MTENDKNIDEHVVKDFGAEWRRFDQSKLSGSDHQKLFDNYFLLFPRADLLQSAVGADFGRDRLQRPDALTLTGLHAC